MQNIWLSKIIHPTKHRDLFPIYKCYLLTIFIEKHIMWLFPYICDFMTILIQNILRDISPDIGVQTIWKCSYKMYIVTFVPVISFSSVTFPPRHFFAVLFCVIFPPLVSARIKWFYKNQNNYRRIYHQTLFFANLY